MCGEALGGRCIFFRSRGGGIGRRRGLKIPREATPMRVRVSPSAFRWHNGRVERSGLPEQIPGASAVMR
jgi:hypothetical protein